MLRQLRRFTYAVPLTACLRPRLSLPLFTTRRHCAAAGAKWACSCGFQNCAFQRQCFSCSKARESLTVSPAASSTALLDGAPAIEDADASSTRTGSATVAPAEGVWMCAACNTFNNPSRDACTHCSEGRPMRHAAKGGAARGSALPQSSAGDHDAASPRRRAPPFQPFKKGDWYCVCGAHNFARNVRCRECMSPSPSPQPGQEPRYHGELARSGDWVCRECGKYNFARRTVCMQCQQPSPERRGAGAANAAASTEAGAAAAGWVCRGCHSMNPPEVHAACVICGTPRK